MSVSIQNFRYEQIKRACVDTLKNCNIGTVPIDVKYLLITNGVMLKTYSSYSSNPRAIEMLMRYSPDAFTIQLSDGRKMVLYNDKMPDARIRFSLTHELGHIVLKHRQESELSEKEADFFASYLLAPPPLIASFKCFTPKELSDRFNVSIEMSKNSLRRFCAWAGVTSRYCDYELTLLSLFGRQIDEKR